MTALSEIRMKTASTYPPAHGCDGVCVTFDLFSFDSEFVYGGLTLSLMRDGTRGLM